MAVQLLLSSGYSAQGLCIGEWSSLPQPPLVAGKCVKGQEVSKGASGKGVGGG